MHNKNVYKRARIKYFIKCITTKKVRSGDDYEQRFLIIFVINVLRFLKSCGKRRLWPVDEESSL